MKKQHTLTVILTALLIALPTFAQTPIATAEANGGGLSFNTKAGFDSYALDVTGPSGQVHSFTFKGETPYFSGLSPRGEQLADGAYTYELVGMPAARGRNAGTATMERQSINGGFVMAGGQIIAGQGDETPLLKDQVFIDDLIVDGSACVGIDCANGLNFGFDTLILKENNLRLFFDDTSSSASFPGNDWRLTANESGNGGLNKFSIDDATAGTSPFTILAGAGNNAIFVNASGNVGIGDGSPVVELHVTDGDSPTLRLEQDGSSGFTPQTWDLAGNETNFFVRDVTGGSKLAFKIRPGSDDNALVIDNDNNVGLGILNATEQLHLRRTDGTSQIYVQNTGTSGAASDLMNLSSDGPARFVLTNSLASAPWQFNATTAEGLRISDTGDGDVEFQIDHSGNVTTSGTVNGVSDRNKKKDFETVNAQAVLAAVTQMPISEWTYKSDAEGLRHMGPMAQDFYAAFGLGIDERHIALTDMSGVALAAIQGLNEELTERNSDLEDRVAALEAMIEKLAADK